VGSHVVGDLVTLNGTTNLSVGSTIYYDFSAPEGGCHSKVCNRKPWTQTGEIRVISGNKVGTNEFLVILNTTGMQSNYYYFWFDALHQRQMVTTDVLVFSDEILPIIENNQLSQPDNAGIHYWMSFPLYLNYTQPCYEVTGLTNLPPGQNVSYSFFILLLPVTILT